VAADMDAGFAPSKRGALLALTHKSDRPVLRLEVSVNALWERQHLRSRRRLRGTDLAQCF